MASSSRPLPDEGVGLTHVLPRVNGRSSERTKRTSVGEWGAEALTAGRGILRRPRRPPHGPDHRRIFVPTPRSALPGAHHLGSPGGATPTAVPGGRRPLRPPRRPWLDGRARTRLPVGMLTSVVGVLDHVRELTGVQLGVSPWSALRHRRHASTLPLRRLRTPDRRSTQNVVDGKSRSSGSRSTAAAPRRSGWRARAHPRRGRRASRGLQCDRARDCARRAFGGRRCSRRPRARGAHRGRRCCRAYSDPAPPLEATPQLLEAKSMSCSPAMACSSVTRSFPWLTMTYRSERREGAGEWRPGGGAPDGTAGKRPPGPGPASGARSVPFPSGWRRPAVPASSSAAWGIKRRYASAVQPSGAIRQRHICVGHGHRSSRNYGRPWPPPANARSRDSNGQSDNRPYAPNGTRGRVSPRHATLWGASYGTPVLSSSAPEPSICRGGQRADFELPFNLAASRDVLLPTDAFTSRPFVLELNDDS